MGKAQKEVKETQKEEKKPEVITLATSKQGRFRAILNVEKELNKSFGATNTIIRLGDKVGQLLPSYSTGLITLDNEVIQTGGIPKGRIIELFGPESGGKTSLALHIAGQTQQTGGIAALVDAEHSLDPTYAKKLGVNVDELIVSQPNNGEQALETAEALIGIVDLIIVDSVAALVPQAELDGEMGDSHMGLQARLMSQACRKLVGKLAKSGTSIIFINQIREKIGVMFGNPETTTGGRALKFYSSVRMKISRTTEQIKEGNETVGHIIKIFAVKNKVGTPFKETNVVLNYHTGFDMNRDAIQLAITKGIVTQSGAWFDFKGERFQGRESLIDGVGKNVITELMKVLATERELCQQKPASTAVVT